MSKIDLPYGLRYELRHYLDCGSWMWRYTCEGALGAVEVWFRHYNARFNLGSEESWSSGFEQHTATPKRGAGKPDHGQCSALSGRACWHDGSSTYGNESWLPSWRIHPNDHDAVFRRLSLEYMERFEPVEEAQP